MDKNIKAVIMAAGKGTRMKSDLPKVLHRIFEKPMLGHILNTINATGIIDESLVIVGHKSELVEDFVTKNYKNVKCLLQEPQLGTGDAVAKAIPSLDGFSGQVIVLSGDVPLIQPETLKQFVQNHNNNGYKLSVMSSIFPEPGNLGRIVRNDDGTISQIVEVKDATESQKSIKEINTGIYCFDWAEISPALLSLQSNNSQNEYYLTDIVAWAIAKGFKVGSFVLENVEESFGINSKSDLADAIRVMTDKIIEKHLDNGVEIIDRATTFISPETTIDAGTVIYPCVYISGKNTIGKNCKIGPFAHIRGDVQLGDNVKVGNYVEVKKSTIKSNTNLSHLSYIGDSEIGAGVNIGAGTITANYDHSTKQKFKTTIGDNVAVGSNSVLVAPILVNKNVVIGAGSVITKDIPEDSLALTRSALRIISDWVKTKTKS